MTTIVLNNNIIIYLSKSENNNKQIIFRIKDSHNKYFEGSCDFENIQDFFEENVIPEKFFEYLEKNHPSIIENKEENEIIIKINAKRNIEIILKEKNPNNNTIKFEDFKEINQETPKNEDNYKIDLELIIGNNEHLILKNSEMKKNYINILYLNKNINKIYKSYYEPEDIQYFYKSLLENKITTEKGDNDKEIKLKITYKNKILTIILKEILLINEDEIIKLKEKYNEKMKQLKKDNEILYIRNKELKEKIDKEKMKNDEILRIHLKNRLKYENALKKNNDIQKLSLNI